MDLPRPIWPARTMLGLVSTPGLVEDPGVVAERGAGPGVLADEDAGGAEAFFGQERVGAGEDLRGGPVRLAAAAAARAGRPWARARPGPAGSGWRCCSARSASSCGLAGGGLGRGRCSASSRRAWLAPWRRRCRGGPAAADMDSVARLDTPPPATGRCAVVESRPVGRRSAGVVRCGGDAPT